MWEKFKLEWDFMTESERKEVIAAAVCAVVIVVLGLLSVTGIWPAAINVYMPLLGILLVLLGRRFANINKTVSWYCYGVAIFIFVCACIIWVSAFLKG